MLVAVYGTLREGDCNHHMLGNEPKFLTQERIPDFQMYNLGGMFPYITRDEGSVLVEVYDVTQEAYDRCNRMEGEAGYETTKIKTSVGEATLWHMTELAHTRQRSVKILSGDWFEWLRKYRPERLSK